THDSSQGPRTCNRVSVCYGKVAGHLWLCSAGIGAILGRSGLPVSYEFHTVVGADQSRAANVATEHAVDSLRSQIMEGGTTWSGAEFTHGCRGGRMLPETSLAARHAAIIGPESEASTLPHLIPSHSPTNHPRNPVDTPLSPSYHPLRPI